MWLSVPFLKHLVVITVRGELLDQTDRHSLAILILLAVLK